MAGMASEKSRRCTARQKDGEPCQAWAVRGSDPPRCGAHGGGATSPGAPAGNQNARKHGAYGDAGDLPADLDARIRDLDRRIEELSAYIDGREDLASEEYIRLLNLFGLLTSRLGRLMRDREQLGGEGGLGEAIEDALAVASEVLGVDLTGKKSPLTIETEGG